MTILITLDNIPKEGTEDLRPVHTKNDRMTMTMNNYERLVLRIVLTQVDGVVRNTTITTTRVTFEIAGITFRAIFS